MINGIFTRTRPSNKNEKYSVAIVKLRTQYSHETINLLNNLHVLRSRMTRKFEKIVFHFNLENLALVTLNNCIRVQRTVNKSFWHQLQIIVEITIF